VGTKREQGVVGDPALGSVCDTPLRAEFFGLEETAIASSMIGPLDNGDSNTRSSDAAENSSIQGGLFNRRCDWQNQLGPGDTRKRRQSDRTAFKFASCA